MPADTSDDVPSPIDLRRLDDAHTWAREAEAKRPWRAQFRAAITARLAASSVRRVLELGSGPGLLAEHVLSAIALERYTLFDFSQPMLELSRDRLGDHAPAQYVLGDFKQPGWTRSVVGPFDAVVSMQAVHEIRHKRHVPGLYRDVHDLLRSGGMLLVCDHEPRDASPLYATEAEQHAAFVAAGFEEVATQLHLHGQYLCSGRRA